MTLAFLLLHLGEERWAAVEDLCGQEMSGVLGMSHTSEALQDVDGIGNSWLCKVRLTSASSNTDRSC